MTTLHVTPYDTLFVRDGKPFSMGEEVWASGLFPPPPSVVYGAMRTHYFSHNTDELLRANTENDPTGDFLLHYIRIVNKVTNTGLFPVPADMVALKEKNKNYCLLQPKPAPAFSNFKYPYLLQSVNLVEDIESGFVTGTFMKKYLTGSFLLGEVDVKTDIWKKEPKIGIMKSRESGSSEEGRLYRTEMYRFDKSGGNLAPYALEIGISQLETQKNGMIKLGGEGKMAAFTTAESSPFLAENTEGVIQKGEKFKVYLLTPAINKAGVEGAWINDSVRLLAVALRHPIALGGFEMRGKGTNAKPGPKPLRKAVPAGTVYYLEALKDIPISTFHLRNLSDELPKQGMGFALVAKLQKYD